MHETKMDSSNGIELNSSEIRFREKFYRLIVSQLFYDGYQTVAVDLSNQLQVIKKTLIENHKISDFFNFIKL